MRVGIPTRYGTLTKRVLMASLAGIVVLLASCKTPASRSASELDELEQAFQSPPNAHRPIAGFDVRILPADFVTRLETVFDRGYAGFQFRPSVDPARNPPSRILSTRPFGLLETYPPEASKWLPKALPGEEGFGSMVRGARPPARDPGPTPGYFTNDWFDRVEAGLRLAREKGGYATFYDEAGFPSGMANHTTPPAFYRKLLSRIIVQPNDRGQYSLPTSSGKLEAVVAISEGGDRIDITAALGSGDVWTAPAGQWQVEAFFVAPGKASGTATDYYGAVDYLDPQAVDWYIAQTYVRMAERLRPFFGNTITTTFFDDVGFFPDEKTWGAEVGERFRQLTGRDPALYYPALWRDIGPETAAARVGFFRARAELIGEGFPKRVGDWARANGLQSTGHAPGQYDPQPTDMFGDPFLFYQHVDMPMVDAIFGHGYGREGFKLVSSAANVADKPIVAAENFTAAGDEMGYRRTMELIVRGVTWFVTDHNERFTPIDEPEDFPKWIGRSSLMLRGAQHVADVAIVYPIESLQAFYSFDAPQNVIGLPVGNYISDDHDYLAVGEMLTSEVHRDFTFLHPDTIASEKLRIAGSSAVLDNAVNREVYRAIILPGGEVASIATVRKLKAFYDAGGAILATSRLPFRSAEFGGDEEVREIVASIFGVDPALQVETPVRVRTNAKGGRALFVATPSPETLRAAFEELQVSADVAFEGDPAPDSGGGVFGYLHKQRKRDQIYFFGNSSSDPVQTVVTLRGRLALEAWDPHTGRKRLPIASDHFERDGEVFTQAKLTVEPLRSIIYVGVPAE